MTPRQLGGPSRRGDGSSCQLKDSLPAWAWAQQVPAVPGDVDEDSDQPGRLLAWLGDECDAGTAHPVVGGLEILDTEEQPDTASELVTNRTGLAFSVRLGQQQPGRCPWRPHDDPTLRSSVIGQRRRVFNELEAEDVDEESDRIVIVIDD